MMRLRAARTWVGLEPGVDALRAVAITRGEIVAAVEVPIAGGDATAASQAFARLAEGLQRQGVSGPVRVVAMPPESSIVSAVLELPPRSSGAPIEMLASAEIARGRTSGAVEVGAFDLPTSKRHGPTGSEYLIVGGEREAILGLLTASERAGLITEAIDTPITSAARVLGSGARMVVEACAASLRLHVCVDQMPRFCYVSHFPTGEHVESRLIEEIDRCAAYANSRFPDTPLQTVLLTGVASREPGLAEAVRREFNAPVAVWNATGWPVGRAALGIVQDPAFAQACALATWGQSVTIENEASDATVQPRPEAHATEPSRQVERSAAA